MLPTSRATGALTVAALAALALAHPAQAGTLIVSGDTNIINGLDGNSIPVNAGNQQFFKNVLGGGKTVVVDSDTDPLTAATPAEVSGFYNTLAGVTSTLKAGPITASTLAGASLFLDVLPAAPFAAGEISALQGFENSGGTLFFLGENTSVPTLTTGQIPPAKARGLVPHSFAYAVSAG